MQPSIPFPPRAYRREGGLLITRRVLNAAALPYFRAQLLALPPLPDLAAGALTDSQSDPALILVWCQAVHQPLAAGALAALDARTPIVVWPSTLDLIGEWETWIGRPNILAGQAPIPSRAPAEVARW